MPSFWENLRFAGGNPEQAGQSYDENEGNESQDMVLYVSHPPPAAGADFPAIIVIQEAFGVTRHIEKVCDRFAEAGYAAVAPALYHRDHPNPKLGYDEMPAVMRYMGNLKDNELVEDINVVIDYLQNKWARTQGQKIGIVGYCVGGRITYLGATSCPGLSAASVYYGGRILVPFGDGPAGVAVHEFDRPPARVKGHVPAGGGYHLTGDRAPGLGAQVDDLGGVVVRVPYRLPK